MPKTSTSTVAPHQKDIESLWAATAPPGPPLTALEGRHVADVAIVGAGFTGLSAALHLAEAGVDTLVVEAGEPGYGASGRNGGQVIPGLKYDPDELERRYGAGVVHTAASGPDLVYDLIARYRIQCSAVRAGWIQPAHTPALLSLVRDRCRQWARRGAAVRELSAADVATLTGTDLYVGGWLDGRGGTVQPLAYARGLARAAIERGVRIFRDSRVQTLQHQADGWRLVLAKGEVSARRVILATNAYADGLHDSLRRSVVPVPSYQLATAPLSAHLRRRILPGGQAVSDTYNLLRYFRLDAHGRLILGARGLYGRRSQAESQRSHDAALREIYPELGEPSYEYRWSGYVAITADHLPHLHDLGSGLHAALGYNGRGVAMATMLGRLVAAQARGASDPEYTYPLTPLRPIPLHAFSRLGVRATVSYLRMKDQQQSAQAGRT